MKKALLVSALLVCTCFMVQAFSNEICDDDKAINIPLKPYLKPIPPVNKPIPLSLVQNIEANYYAGMLTMVFNVDLGNADITVVNTSTGEMWMDSVSGVGATSIYTSGNAGYYTIYIITDCGEYTGAFEL